jgi:riboflavin kinase/FMN adenylyltransferase
MQVHFSMEQMPEIRFPVVTMGSFDGVHAGHRVIISRLNTLAQQAGGSSVLITFHPHPRKVLYPMTAGKELRLITTLEEKCRVLEETGLDHLVVMEFTREFALTTSQHFVEDYLVRKLHAHIIVVGFNHFFGHNREGNFDSLYRVKEKHGFNVEEIPEQEIQNETVSSTKIRNALSEGHIQRANAYLEHHFILLAGLEPLSQETKLFKRPCFGIFISDPNKLIPPPGSYAVSFPNGEKLQKGLIRISPAGILLFPLGGDVMQPNGGIFIRFHKHLVKGSVEQIESDITNVEELIY